MRVGMAINVNSVEEIDAAARLILLLQQASELSRRCKLWIQGNEAEHSLQAVAEQISEVLYGKQ